MEIVTQAELNDVFCLAAGVGRSYVEAQIYHFCCDNVDDYDGGVWENVIIKEGVAYRRWRTNKTKLMVHNKGAFWQGELTPDAMGVVATLYAINITLWAVYQRNEPLGRSLERWFYKLKDWAYAHHPEAAQIAMAID